MDRPTVKDFLEQITIQNFLDEGRDLYAPHLEYLRERVEEILDLHIKITRKVFSNVCLKNVVKESVSVLIKFLNKIEGNGTFDAEVSYLIRKDLEAFEYAFDSSPLYAECQIKILKEFLEG